ncbi:hypothetical protein SDC9_180032 [bioreactor metagenome]|uniref:Uncharacterized protein n=1 Tax=bioreactor metagenome TaxID=1076179 RepID=A0A645H9T5_9ZZZZ
MNAVELELQVGARRIGAGPRNQLRIHGCRAQPAVPREKPLCSPTQFGWQAVGDVVDGQRATGAEAHAGAHMVQQMAAHVRIAKAHGDAQALQHFRLPDP